MKKVFLLVICVAMFLSISACAQPSETTTDAQTTPPAGDTGNAADPETTPVEKEQEEALTQYIEVPSNDKQPYTLAYDTQKDRYKILLKYKIIHTWYDPIHEGAQYAVDLFKEAGVDIDLELYAPDTTDVTKGIERVESAAGEGFDVIAWDSTDPATETNVVDKLVENGTKIMTYGSMDIDGSKRVCYTGIVDPIQFGHFIGEEFAKQMNYEGTYCIFAGAVTAANHQQYVQGVQEVLEQYPDMEMLDMQYDEDDVEKCLQITENFIQMYPDCKGFIRVDGATPVGIGQPVAEADLAGEVIVVVSGSDTNLEDLGYLEKGAITSLMYFDLFRCGFDTIRHAVMIADGVEPSEETYCDYNYFGGMFLYQEDAAAQIAKVQG